MITKLYAARLAEYGISVFEIRPGIIETDMTSKVKEKYEEMIDEGYQSAIKAIPQILELIKNRNKASKIKRLFKYKRKANEKNN